MNIERKSRKLGGRLDPRGWAEKYFKEVPKEIIPEEEKEEYENTNVYRKKQGLDISKDLELVPCDICGIEILDLKMIPMDLGKGLQFVYHCNDCLYGKK